MRDISGKIRQQRIRQLRILIGSYEKALKSTSNETTRKNLEGLIKKAKNEIKDLN